MQIHAGIIEWDDDALEPEVALAETEHLMHARVLMLIEEHYYARTLTPIVREMRDLLGRVPAGDWDALRAELGNVNGPVITTYLKEI